MDEIVFSLFVLVFEDEHYSRYKQFGVVDASDCALSVKRICDVSVAKFFLSTRLNYRLLEDLGFDTGICFKGEEALRRLLREMHRSLRWNYVSSLLLGKRRLASEASSEVSRFVNEAIERKGALVLSYLETWADSPDDVHCDPESRI